MVAISFSFVNTAGTVRLAGVNIVLCVLLLFCKTNIHINNTDHKNIFLIRKKSYLPVASLNELVLKVK